MVTTGYKGLHVFFSVLGYILKLGYSGYNWLQEVTGIFSVVGHILKLGYSGYNWLQEATGIFSIIGYILKLGYSGYKGLQVYFLFLGTS